jgi:hypothetical protein
VSYPLLQRLVKLVSEHPEYIHISVEGHADERGPEDFNQRLSEERARSVMEFMIKKGVARDRLESHGFGSSRPLVDKANEYAWLLNRRVEFQVTRKMQHGPSATTATGTSVPSEANLPKNPEKSPDPPPVKSAPPSSTPVEGERETATPPPEAGHPELAPKPKDDKKSGGEKK